MRDSVYYRYLFYDWLFRNVAAARGLFEREAARRHNKRNSRYLPSYLRRWLVLSSGFFASGWIAEQAIHAPFVSAVFMTCYSFGVAYLAVTAAAWIGLRTLP